MKKIPNVFQRSDDGRSIIRDAEARGMRRASEIAHDRAYQRRLQAGGLESEGESFQWVMLKAGEVDAVGALIDRAIAAAEAGR